MDQADEPRLTPAQAAALRTSIEDRVYAPIHTLDVLERLGYVEVSLGAPPDWRWQARLTEAGEARAEKLRAQVPTL